MAENLPDLVFEDDLPNLVFEDKETVGDATRFFGDLPLSEKKKSVDSMAYAEALDVDPSQVLDSVDMFNKELAPQQKKGIIDNYISGLDQSVIGLSMQTEMPEIFEPEGRKERLAQMAGTLTGDFPLMVVGGLLGAGAGPITAGAGAFGLPAGLRQVYMDKLESGEVKDFADFGDRLENALQETIKGQAVGAVTTATGTFAPSIITKALTKMGISQKVIAPIAKAFGLGGEVTAMTTAPALLEGRLPTEDDLIDSFLLVAGLKGAVKTAKGIEKIPKNLRTRYKEYKKTELAKYAEPITDKLFDIKAPIKEEQLKTDVQVKTTEVDTLTTEARKYKTADEFVESQGKVLFHGSPEADRIFKEGFDVKKAGTRTKHKPEEVGIHFTDSRSFAEGYSLEYKKANYKRIKDLLGYLPEHQKAPKGAGTIEAVLDIKNPIRTEKSKDITAEFIADAKKKGYDGIIADHGGGTEYVVFKPEQIKTKQQLTDIWNKAQKQVDPEFKKPTIKKYITPSKKTAKELGFGEAFKELEKVKDVELPKQMNMSRIYVDEMVKGLHEISGVSKSEKLAYTAKRKVPKAERQMAEILSEHEKPPKTFNDGTELTPDQTKWFVEYTELMKDTLKQTNKARVESGIPPIKGKKNYFKHLSDDIANEMLEGRYDLPEQLSVFTNEQFTTKIRNPAEIRRKLGDKLIDLWSKDIRKVTDSALYFNLKEQMLAKPQKNFKEWVKVNEEFMPEATRKWAKQYNDYLLGKESPFDSIVHDTWDGSVPQKLLNYGLRPFGRTAGRKAITTASQSVGHATILGTIWGAIPRQIMRNKMQVVQATAFVGSRNLMKSYTPNKTRDALIEKSGFVNDYTAFEELPKTMQGKIESAGLAPFQWSAVTNVTRTMKASYHQLSPLFESPKYKDFTGKNGKKWASDKRTYKEEKGFLYPEEEAKMIKAMEDIAGYAQFSYLPSGMPEIFRNKTLAGVTRLNSWWMNYFGNFTHESLRRMTTGETVEGLPLPPQMRMGYARYLLIGAAVYEGLGYGASYLQGVLPDRLNPASQVLLNSYKYLSADTDKQKKSALNNMKRGFSGLTPGGNAFYTWKSVLDGNWEKALLYKTQREKLGLEGKKLKR